jgi:adenylate cyclase class 2
MVARRGTTREIEIKLRVSNLPALMVDLGRQGALERGRVLERNTVFDTPDSDFRRQARLLRLRLETPAPSAGVRGGRKRAMLTSKVPAPRSRSRRYKQNLEREAEVRFAANWTGILGRLGLRAGFRYEKYRTAFRLPGVHLDLDETPVGVFLELEGNPRAIDRVARALGYSPRDYIRSTYWDLYRRECERRRRNPGNMLFPR